MLTEINIQKKCQDIEVGDYFLYNNEIYIKSDLECEKVSINIKTGYSAIFSETPVIPLKQKMSFACDFKKIRTNDNMIKTGDCILLKNYNLGIVTSYKFKDYYIIDLFTGNCFLLHNDDNYNVLPNAKIIIG